MYNISKRCPNISVIKLCPSDKFTEYTEFKIFEWCSNIIHFQNLEELEIKVNIDFAKHGTVEYFLSVVIARKFTENPMTKLKKLKFSHVNAFCQDELLGSLFDAFPNLETLTVEKEVNGGPIYWKFHELLNVLRSLGHVKNLTLPNMNIHLAPYGADHQNFQVTEKVFRQALHIIQTQFPLSCGNLKITDDKYGFVIIKEKMKRPKIFNQMQLNRSPVSKIIHCGKSQIITMYLKAKRQKQGYRSEFRLHASIIQTLYGAIDQEKENLNQSSFNEIEGLSLVVTERSENCKTTELCLQTSFLRKYQVPKEYQSNDNEIYVHSELSLSKELVKKVYKTFVENNPAYNILYVPQAI